jgi:hypothetical protein
MIYVGLVRWDDELGTLPCILICLAWPIIDGIAILAISFVLVLHITVSPIRFGKWLSRR